MKATVAFLLVVLAVVTAKPNSDTNAELNTSPIIGVLVKEVFSDLEKLYPGKYKSYIPASIVKFVEGGGARVVPVWLGQDKKYYEDIVKKTNGILFPPGSPDLKKKCGSADAVLALYDLAVEENKHGHHYPIFSIGQGLEALLYGATKDANSSVPCKAIKSAYALNFKPDFESSKMYSTMPSSLIAAHKKEEIVSSYQSHCLTEDKLKELKISDDWHVLATNKDSTDVEFISSIEHKKYPFYGVQFRPELHLYEWKDTKRFVHSLNAILSSQYFAAFFAHEANKNANKYASLEDEQKDLIYNYRPKYTRKVKKDFFHEQCYMFGADKGTIC